MNFKFGSLNVLDSLSKAKRLCCDIEIVAAFISCVVTLNWALRAKRVSRHIFLCREKENFTMQDKPEH